MYRLSESYLKIQRNLIITMSIIMPIMVFAIFFILFYAGNAKIYLSVILISSIFIILIIELTIIITYKILTKKYKNLTIEISENKIIRTNEKFKEEFNISDIKKMTVYKMKDGELFSIKLNFENSTVILAGFENFNNLCEEITLKIQNKEIIVTKTKIINQLSPLYLATVLFLSFSFVTALTLFNKSLMELFKVFIWLVVGIMFLFFKPTSKTLGKRFRIFEIILGLVFLFLIAMEIILELLKKF